MGIFDFFLSGRNAEILKHEYEGRLLSSDKKAFTLEVGGGGERPVEHGQFPYYFVIGYKKKHLLRGYYVFSEILDDSSLKGFVVQYEVKEGLVNTREGFIDFEYKLQSLKKEQPKFYFLIGGYGSIMENWLLT